MSLPAITANTVVVVTQCWLDIASYAVVLLSPSSCHLSNSPDRRAYVASQGDPYAADPYKVLRFKGKDTKGIDNTKYKDEYVRDFAASRRWFIASARSVWHNRRIILESMLR
jgi:ABC-type amino acid transport substrate-binding protein